MDDRRLQSLLKDIEVPPPDDDARARALGLAMAAFDEADEKGSSKAQGSGVFSRLMSGFNKNTRRRPMNRRFVYSGLATAMTLVLVAGIGMHRFKAEAPDTQPVAQIEEALETVTQQRVRAERSAAAQAESDDRLLARLDQVEKPIPEPAASPTYSTGVYEYRAQAKREVARSAMPEYEMGMADGVGGTMGADFDIAVPDPLAPPASMAMADASAWGGVSESVVMSPDIVPDHYQDRGRDQFQSVEQNPVHVVGEDPVSTFSVDVDSASYAFIRRQIQSGVLPQKDAVRIEEMINYFDYAYPLPENKGQPFRPTVAVVPSPWKESNLLIHIGIKGFELPMSEAPKSNLVFLLDVSGSMNSPDKLPLLKNSMKLLLDGLKPDDSVAIVVYAGAAGTVLEPTPVKEKAKILQALERLEAGGSTAGAEGIRQAYQLAESRFEKDAVNRVILATDGDFNVGIVNHEELKGFIERKRQTGIFLSVLGFGQGNLNDQMMQELAQNGNGVAAYIDTLNEARKVLVEEASSTLFPIAKDVKIQVEFNPAVVAEYRLIGYETRALNREDFNNDAVDAGDIGAGHSVTAIYEITPVTSDARMIDQTRYQAQETAKRNTEFAGEYAFLKIRYKQPDKDTSELITTPITEQNDLQRAGEKAADWLVRETGWSAAVAGFGQLLKGGKYTGGFDYDAVIRLAEQNKGKDGFGYRSEFIQLVRLAKSAAAMQAN